MLDAITEVKKMSTPMLTLFGQCLPVFTDLCVILIPEEVGVSIQSESSLKMAICIHRYITGIDSDQLWM